MRILDIEQKSDEWWAFKVGKISGTRFGEVISGRKNRLPYKLANEIIDGYIEQSDYVDEDMQYGIDNESLAIDLYEKKTGIKFERGCVVLSDFSNNHIASPDGYNLAKKIIVEVKCTMDGSLHLQRKYEGAEAKYLPQIKNYFAVSDEVEEVYFISYCGFKPLHPIYCTIYKRSDFDADIKKGRLAIKALDIEVNEIVNSYSF